jgi:hypothetical protein
MRIQHDFEYDADWSEIADEFCAHDSGYQSDALNSIGLQFMIWSHDKKRTFIHIQMLEIAEQLDDKGKLFIQTLCDYMGDKAESEES